MRLYAIACIPLAFVAATSASAQGFGPQQVISTATDAAQSVYAIDLDGDGDADAVSASREDKVAWHENLGNGTFGPEQVISTAVDYVASVYATDLDGDGDADVLSASSFDHKIAWYENLGNGTFGAQQVISTSAEFASSVYATDLDGDGDADVLSASFSGNNVAWYENLGAGAFGPQQVISTAADFANSVYATDLDGDGDADVLSASQNDDKIAWYENLGNGTFGPQQVISTAADNAQSVYATDLDGDGDADVLSASLNDDKVAWYENVGAGAFGPQQVISTAEDGPRSVYATDLDGDGDADVLSAFSFDDSVAWYENFGNGSFGPQQLISTSTRCAKYVYATDLDGDGDADVLSTSICDDKVAWYENLSPPPTPTLNPANGHHYLYVASNVTWSQARAAAEATSFMGVQGHLATISDATENAFVTMVDQDPDGGWLGGFQDTSAPGYSEPGGGWFWVTGEPLAYTNWRTSTGEPNDGFGSAENYLEMVENGLWNDATDTASIFNQGYVIEYDTPIVNPANGNAYLVIHSDDCWDECRVAAESMTYMGFQGHLATITSTGEQNFVDNLLASDPHAWSPWIGGYQDTTAPDYSEPAGGWRWITGEPFQASNWAVNQPDNSQMSGPSEEHLLQGGLGWLDSPRCSGSNGYLVEFETGLQPVVNPTNRHSYAVIDGNLTWDEARAAAESIVYQGFQGHLATITSASERDFVNGLRPADKACWLGGYQDTSAPDYSEPGGGWRWITGEAFSFTDWAVNEPNNYMGSDEDYVELNGSGPIFNEGWNDQIQDGRFDSGSYIVEFSDSFGENYCTGPPNSTGMNGELVGTGSQVAADNHLILDASQLPPFQFGMYITSATPATTPIANGILCLGGNLGRFGQPGQIRQADASGRFSLTVDITAIPTTGANVSIMSGQTRYFQVWHRDAGGAGANFTNGLAIRFY